MRKELLKPKDVAELLGMDVQSLVDVGVNRISSDSLNKLARENPKKYKLQIFGIVCMKLDISIEELILYFKQRESFVELLEKRQNSHKVDEKV